MLEIKKLNAGYEDLQILKDVSLKIELGKIAVLMGPNGAGKTTLLRSIFNLTNITSGQIFFREKEITGSPTHQLIEHGIAYLPQGRINFSTLTVEENLELGGYHIEDKKVLGKNIQKIYEEFPDLKKKKNQQAFSLSGGQQQMLALARSLIQEPEMLLLDEPSLGLSPKLIKETFKRIRKINQRFKTTMIIVEHNIKSVLEIADLGFIMANGKIVTKGPAAELKNKDIMRDVFLGKLE